MRRFTSVTIIGVTGVLALAGLALVAPSATAAETCLGSPVTDHVVLGQTFVGDSSSEVIIGTVERDDIDGGGGNDKICSLAGIDRVHGGTGDDQILGGSNRDTTFGDSGADVLHDGDAGDIARGGTGNDTLLILFSGAGTFFGEDGNDRLQAATEGTTGTTASMRGGPGNDTILGSGGNDLFLSGGANSDTIHGSTGNDRMFCDLPEEPPSGADFADGGPGIDTAASCETTVNVP
jgi:Ca2+-binding RTX toxin-like protein